MGNLDLLELQQAKLISKRFHSLANVDQLWRCLTLASDLDGRAMKEAREVVCGCPWNWQRLLRTATLIDRENRRMMQGAIAEITLKIRQVRDALVHQTSVIEETHSKLEILSDRLAQMEQQNRARELERKRAMELEIQRLEDERWMKEWDKECLKREKQADRHLTSDVLSRSAKNRIRDGSGSSGSSSSGSIAECNMTSKMQEIRLDDDDDRVGPLLDDGTCLDPSGDRMASGSRGRAGR
ncbi:hypothetical protein BGX31_007961 [Mortierella sp. GBA43]|nr:hypothetical protein BGX31_007961 [Mortierella sp. GBA43]